MRWTFAILIFALLIIVGLGIVGSRVISLPRINDPFPSAVRTQLAILDDDRREIEWLLGKARMAGRGNELPEERQVYDELAPEANAWLKTAEQGLVANNIDTAFLTRQFEEGLKPKANAVLAKLTPKMRWMGSARRDSGWLRVAAAEIDHLSSDLENSWHDVSTYFKFARSRGADSKKVALNELEDMKWVPWSAIMAEQF
jgi:hypothetical protein